MTTTRRRTPPPLRSLIAVIAVVGTVGASIGLAAGLVELTLGSSLRSWVGDKQDTTRLGLATVLLAMLALTAALALRRQAISSPRRLAAAVALLGPGLIGFTTVGRLWYLPGALLLTASVMLLADLRHARPVLGAALARNWTAVLTTVLALLYLFLGATALGLAGILGMLGGLAALAVLALHCRLARPLGIAILVLAVLPFALLTWWSIATPLIGALLFAYGASALRPMRRISFAQPRVLPPSRS